MDFDMYSTDTNNEAARIEAYEVEGLTTSDAQAVVEAEDKLAEQARYTATYSPDDNKLRLSCTRRLDPEIYNLVKAAGFKWAPKQEQFIAPMWTPGREDLCLKLAGEIGDEDTSLLDRAEQRAERFENYSEKRENEAERTRAGVDAIAGNIPMGQPILIGHHSEKRARKDAEKIRNGMSKAVKLWETSKYWQERAAGAIHHAKYKELPAVRARRIKGIEADKRRVEREKADNEKALALWTSENLTLEKARTLAGYSAYGLRVCNYFSCTSWSAWDVLRPEEERYNKACPTGWTLEMVQDVARKVYPRHIAHNDRWLAHYNNRLTYEKAMLDEQGASALLDKKPRPKQLPICNYKQAVFVVPCIWRSGELDTLPQVELTAEQYQHISSDQRGTRVVNNSHRIRMAVVDFNEDGTIRRFASHKAKRCAVFLTDSKTHTPPEGEAPTPQAPVILRSQELTPSQAIYAEHKKSVDKAKDAEFMAMKDTLKNGGIQIAVADQLFVTPLDLAQRVIDEAGIVAR